MSLSIDLSDKIVFISGGVSGIGLGIAQVFAQAGAQVIVCAELEETHPLVYRLKDSLGSSLWHYYKADVTDVAVIETMVKNIQSTYGKIDVLVSNAGKNIFSPVEECTQEDWNFNQKLNLEAHWQLAKAIKPLLAASGDALVVLIGSNHAFSSMPGCFPYSVAKAGLLAMVRSIAMEWGPGIRAVGIAPGFIDTPGNQEWFDSFDDPIVARANTVNLHPVKRLGTAEEIGGWCVFLASKYGAFANGTTYLIDGGRSALMQD
ncbi:SDR family oxidoreductase [Sphingobacterium sp. UT-1RO-CII-1]|uniref:SDR family oxidoreductase n=1 Tax=Sphingobacterium sp. UT-1RO-CII-1 TaxID=2995225 RepID=UPI00227BBE21|nr:SDR family oxidoreductase [Sphingobacterium sp. UT-1RO-CII-1]MCY4780639.1 SDR family oxidoreductase [Sphingobacterium sp. UT-1RO-CII-1]